MDRPATVPAAAPAWSRPSVPCLSARELRHAWAPLRELDKDALTLRAIEQMITLEQRRGSRGA